MDVGKNLYFDPRVNAGMILISKERINEVVSKYEGVTIGVIGSHSALDVCDGAKEEGLRNLVVCQRGREKTYERYFLSRGKIGIVDEVIVLNKFSEILKNEVQDTLREKGVVFVPNRSFTSYVPIERIESEFEVPMFGNRYLLRSEERGIERDYYWLLERAGLPYPRKIDPEEIDCLVIVKLPHAVKRLERGFFTAASHQEFTEKAEKLMKIGVIKEEDLKRARIEEYVIGPVFNLDFFYSPIMEEEHGIGLELLGIDWRFETSLDGHVRIPAAQQLTLPENQFEPEYVVCGHSYSTLRESLLERAFELGEKYVEATKKYYPPGIIGPFTLQTVVDKDLEFYIYDVSPRIGGGTNAHMSIGHPYGNSLWRCRMSTGRRIALEIKLGLERGELEKLVT